jgi:phosphoethanolamine N-methyltransferase
MSKKSQYSDAVIEGMEKLFGEGFLSPGGADEVHEMLEGVALAGRAVLDLGCGIGGATLMLAGNYGAAHVTGVDLEADSIARTRAKLEAAGLAGRVTLIEVTPGPLPLADESVDLVFCKDVVCHVAHKAPFFAEAFRVLRPGGQFLCTDFFDGEDDEGGEGAVHFNGYVTTIADYGLSFWFEPRAVYADGLASVGFEPVEFRDNSTDAAAATRRETEFAASPESAGLAAALGEAMFALRVKASTFRLKALESGGFKHGHFRATRPG